MKSLLLYVLAFNFNGAVTTAPATMPVQECIEKMNSLNPNVYTSAVCINSADPRRQITTSGPNFAERSNWNTRRAIPSDASFYTPEEKKLIYGEQQNQPQTQSKEEKRSTEAKQSSN